MLCTDPYVRDPSGKFFKLSVISGDSDLAIKGVPFPCGHCLPCRLQRSREYAFRAMLEMETSAYSFFVTLTYNDEHLPRSAQNVPTLDKTEFQNFIKLVRYHIQPDNFRYLASGEYGPLDMRPHYHFILYSQRDPDFGERFGDYWSGRGFYTAERLTVRRCAYAAGYTVDKLGKLIYPGKDAVKPFLLQSRKPGIGFDAALIIADTISKSEVLLNEFRTGCFKIAYGAGKHPLGRYLTDVVAKFLGDRPNPDPYISMLFKKYVEASRCGSTLSSVLVKESEQRNHQIAFKHSLSLQLNNRAPS